jgi:hypothetical protein
MGRKRDEGRENKGEGKRWGREETWERKRIGRGGLKRRKDMREEEKGE